MDKTPSQTTLEELAERLKVSRRTISRVLRGDGYVAGKTRDKVLRHLQGEDYVPNVRAAELAAGRVRSFGLVVPKSMVLGTIDNYVGTIISTSTEIAGKEGTSLALYPAPSFDLKELHRLVRSRVVGGLKAPPLFVLGFAALAAARGLGWLSPALVSTLMACSSFLLLAGVGAISAKLGPKALLEVKPKLAMMLGTVTLAVAVLAYALARIFF